MLENVIQVFMARSWNVFISVVVFAFAQNGFSIGAGGFIENKASH